MSAPPILRLVGERRVSVVRDAAAVWRVLGENPVESCMVAARVADYGVEPNSIGGELWTRGGADESLCFAGANLIPAARQSDRPERLRRRGEEHGAAVFVAGRQGRPGAAHVASGSSRPGARRVTCAMTNR